MKTSVAALEVINGLPPLELMIQKEAIKTFIKMKTTHPELTIPEYGHVGFAKHLLRQQGHDPEAEWDSMFGTLFTEKNYEVNFNKTFEKKTKPYMLKAYSDGSKFGGGVGCGYTVCSYDIPVAEGAHRLGDPATVFQAESEGLRLAAKRVNAMIRNGAQVDEAHFYLDNRSVIYCLNGRKCTSKTIWNCFEELNSLGLKTRVEIRWIRGHSNHKQNDRADELAKLGTTITEENRVDDSNDRDEFPVHIPPPLPAAFLRKVCEDFLQSKWTESWVKDPTKASHTKKFFKVPDLKRVRAIHVLSREEHGRISRALTGFDYRKSFHAKTIGSQDVHCPNCLEIGEEHRETGFHAIAECPRWTTQRLGHFGDKDPEDYDMRDVVRFLRLKGIKDQEKGISRRTNI